MQIDEKTYNRMPDDIKRMFVKENNPSKDEVEQGFPETTTGNLNKVNKSIGGDGIYGGGKGRDDIGHKGSSGSASRFFYCAKASKKERTEGGTIDNKHPTVKPLDLMQYLCRLVTPPGGVVLDPFVGSGTTPIAAVEEGFRCIGIEREQEYMDLIAQRIEAHFEREDDHATENA